MCLSVDSFHVHKSVHDDERGDSSDDYGRHGFRSQYTKQYLFYNLVERVDVDGRCGYMSHIILSTNHNPCGLSRSLGLSVNGHEVSGHMSNITHLNSYNHGGIYTLHPRFPQ